MGNYFSAPYRQCKCGAGKAIYRCSRTIRADDVKNAPATEPGLAKHWVQSYYPGVAKYIACDECVGDCKKYFHEVRVWSGTRSESGWCENTRFRGLEHTMPYEGIKIDI